MIFVIVGLCFPVERWRRLGPAGWCSPSITLVAALLVRGKGGLDAIADYVADGLVLCLPGDGPIIPIAGSSFVIRKPQQTILGEGAPDLFDWGNLMRR